MISIQELGTSILSDHPLKMYVIGGTEYGVKDKYISKLEELYGEKLEYAKVTDVIDTMSKRHLVPLKPALYVVRYDETFVSSISDILAKKIRNCNIIGTLVCVYSDEKSINKIDKYLPEFTSFVESVNIKFVEKYLHSDFPKLDDRSIKIAASCSQNYGQARNICRSMSYVSPDTLARISEPNLAKMFGCTSTCNESDIQKGIASRNFNYLVQAIDNYENLDTLHYTILQTMIELEKIASSKYSNSDLREYAKQWTIQDIYYMFMNTYSELEKLRSNTSSNVYSSLIYLFSLLTFRNIPSVEVMNDI